MKKAAFLILITFCPFCNAEVERSRNFEQLKNYMNQLEEIRQLWRQAAQITYDGDIQQAYILINQPLDLAEESNIWIKKTRNLGVYLRGIDKRWSNSYLDEGARALICLDCPQLAIEYLQELQQQKGELEFSHTIHLSQAYLETGKYQEAKQLLQSLITKDTADDWKERLNARIEKIDNLITIAPDNPFCAPIFRQEFNWCGNRISPIIWTWQCGRDLEHLNILASLFKSAGDDYGHSLVLNIIAAREFSGTDKSDSANALLELANQAHKAKNYPQAFTLWRQIENDYPDTSAWGKALFNTGIALKEQKQFNAAIQQFEKLLTSKVNDCEPGSDIMEAYRNYRPKAQWEIANCLLAQGKYADALTAYRTSQTKYPFQSWCGTCRASYEGRNALYQGLCCEHLGQYDAAIKCYFRNVMTPLTADPASIIRIVDLYESQNQVETLKKILDEIDKYLNDKYEKENGAKLRAESNYDEHRFTKPVRRILEIRELVRKEENVPLMVEMVSEASGDTYPYEYESRIGHWEAIEAAKGLASYPEKAVPLLRGKIAGTNQDKLIYYALALCKTEEAAGILKDASKTATNCWQKMALEYALKILEQGPPPSEADEGVDFPALPEKAILPQRLAEIDDDVAFEASLPKEMTLDLSTPQATMTSVFTAAKIGKKDLYDKCICDNPKLSNIFGDLSALSRKGTSIYELSQPGYITDDIAEITLHIKEERHDESVVFILNRINEQWLINRIREVK